MRDLRVAHEAALVEQHVQVVDRLEAARDRPDQEVAVAARAHQRVGAEEVVLAEVAAGGHELALVRGALGGGAAAPGRIHLHGGVLHVVALAAHCSKFGGLVERRDRTLRSAGACSAGLALFVHVSAKLAAVSGERTFVKYTFIKVDPAWRRRTAATARRTSASSPPPATTSPRTTSCAPTRLVGTRGDCDLMVRASSPNLEPIHELHVVLNQSGLMRFADIPHSYLAMTKESSTRDEPQPLEPRPGADAKYLIVYPMWKKREWYRLPAEERMRIMREHIAVGRRYPDRDEHRVQLRPRRPGVRRRLRRRRPVRVPRPGAGAAGTESSAYTESETPSSPASRLPSSERSTRSTARRVGATALAVGRAPPASRSSSKLRQLHPRAALGLAQASRRVDRLPAA